MSKSLISKQITYSGMIWLLVAQLVVMLPFTLYLPLWLLAVMLLSAGWRLHVLAGGTLQPSRSLRVILVALGIGGLLLSGLQFPSLEAMSSLLLLGFAFKSLEAVQRRDALVMIFIGYFLVALFFLYTQSMLASLYGIFSLVVLTAALISVQQTISAFSSMQQVRFNVRLAAMMLLLCLPLMLLLFMLAPRFGPMWSLPVQSGQARTGMSDSMAPGDISQLSQSDDLAFRVSFSGERPAQSQLYWRGLVLNHFDGRKWTQFPFDYDLSQLKSIAKQYYAYRPERVNLAGEPLRYEAVYEKTGQPWLFTLTPSVQVKGDVLKAADYRVMAEQNLQSPLMLRATSYPEAILDTTLSHTVRRLAQQLPERGDERSRALAERLYQQTDNNPAAYVQAVLDHFREQQFHYTLRPPLMGRSSTIDAFLFEAQRGFCEHYAGSFVFLMRAVGIPARVVVGYQGGEWNVDGGYLLVRQYDAHAWAEVWLAGQGWVRVDPTAAIAPERVEQGLEAAVREEGSFLEGQGFNSRNVPLLNRLSLRMDALQYGWQRWVLSYDNETRFELLTALLGKITVARMALLAGGAFAVIVLLWLVWLGLMRKPEKEALEHRLYRRFCARLAKAGVVRPLEQAPSQFAQHAVSALPEKAAAIQHFTQTYEQLCYGAAAEPERVQLLRDLRQSLRQLR